MSLFLTAKVRLLGLVYSSKDAVVEAGRSLRDAFRDVKDSWRSEGEAAATTMKNEQMSNGEWKKTKWQLARLSATVCGIEFCYAAETGGLLLLLFLLLLLLLRFLLLLLLLLLLYSFHHNWVWDLFYDLSNTAVFTIFPFKITSDPCPLIISNLHRKCKNQKSKNMGTWQIRLPRCPCFSKCKKFCFFPDLKLSMRTIFFSKILIFKKNIDQNSINAK